MKELSQSISADLNPLVLYEEDLRELFALLKENCTKVTIKVGNLEFDEINELISHFAPNRIWDLEIFATNPLLQIDFKTPSLLIFLTKQRARLYVDPNTPAFEGLYHKCLTILKRRSKVYGVLCSLPLYCVSTVIFLPLFIYVSNECRLSLASVYFLYEAWVLFVYFTRHSLIYARKADTLESFFLRNKDHLFLDVIKTLVGLLIGLVLQRYFHLLK